MTSQGLIHSEFIFGRAPFAGCHASTIEQVNGGLVAAWFAGTDEGEKDVVIWVARHEGSNWSKPVEAANGLLDPYTRHPCWNPVLYQPPRGNLILFY